VRPEPAARNAAREVGMDGPPSLVPVTDRPFNAEAPLPALALPITPTPLFFVRNHFDVPVLDAAAWRVRVGGRVERDGSFGVDELKALPRHTVAVTLECAGNGRRLARPQPPGTPWHLGAVSTAEFTGVALRDVLARHGPLPGAAEIVFEGADAGVVDGGREEPFARSLPLERALDGTVLLAWAMNGEPLTPDHGHPLRLLVPGHYGMDSVKWLASITVTDGGFAGFFQRTHYVYTQDGREPEGAPLGRMRVRSLILEPAAGDEVAGALHVSGVAWSGAGPVTGVELSDDGGGSWWPARLLPPPSPWAMCGWQTEWRPRDAGARTLMARATDAAGDVQPLEPVWNALGYANNAAHRVTVRVRRPAPL
jgi:DMSO/TMAO reductase YedYZ molybdopterin-dependent catalytic subunit